MEDIFMHHIYLMYSLWFAAGVMLLAYIGYRRKRKHQVKLIAAITPLKD